MGVACTESGGCSGTRARCLARPTSMRAPRRGGHSPLAPSSASPASGVYPHQAERLTEALMRGHLGALVATSRENVAYLTGFSSFADDGPDARSFAVFTPNATA